MTREEAKKYIGELKMYANSHGWDEEYQIACDIAMNELEQEPTTKNDLGVDCISRQAVINEMEKRHAEGDCITKGFIKNMPSVTPQEPKKGHWISHGEHCENLGVMPSGLGAYKWCSNCDCGIDVWEWHRKHYNYCPNCGAKMVEPQESED